jgi:glycosyltransferase involved in cell wall biosynthesis
MKVLVVHNSYQQRGGEDAVVEAETDLLSEKGHSIVRFARHNDELRTISPASAVVKAVDAVWATTSVRMLRDLISREKPDVAHFHNTFPLISPAAYYACTKAGIPVVQTLHNYRLLCPTATFVREGRVCQDCLGKGVPWPGIWHACYRGSVSQSAVLGSMLAIHKMLRTWQTKVTTYIALSEFARRLFIQGGIPRNRITVKPNFVSPDPGPKLGRGEYALFVGRCSEEKGVQTLLDAWAQLDSQIPLVLIGDGPLREGLHRRINDRNLFNVNLLGQLPQNEVLHRMRGARFLICPSIWFEGFPVTVAEAFACGLPVLSSRIGGLAEIIEDGRTGLHFNPGDVSDLASKAKWAWAHERETRQMGCAARAEFEAKYTADNNYSQLMNIYKRALGKSGEHVAHGASPALRAVS